MKCKHCGKDAGEYSNFCSWGCQIEQVKANGGTEHRPNGLPVRCIRHDGLMLEHEHGDHPDYKFPVDIYYASGKAPRDSYVWVNGLGEKTPMTDEEVEAMQHQTHALIYTDGSVAITMYEACYAMWYLRTGEFGGGSLWEMGDWKLTPESLEKIRALRPTP